MAQKGRTYRAKLFGAGIAVAFLIILGTIVYNALEGWSALDAAYFTVITLATIGYGDLVPTHATSKVFTMFFAFAGVGVFLFAMMTIAEHYFTERVSGFEKKFKKMSIKAIEKFSPELKEPTTRRGFVKRMAIDTKEAMRAKREEIKKKKNGKKKK